MALLIGVSVLLPLAAPAYMSTGPTGDRGWFWQNPLPQGNDLRSTSWVSNTSGWMVGVSGTALKTTDGGLTWAVEDPGTTRDLTGVSFVDANNGWICGVSGTVLHTTNGGTTWVAQAAPTVPAARNLRALSFFDANVGVAVGDLGTTTSTIVYTNNGGTTWRTAACTATVGLSGCQMVTASTGWAVGGAGVVLKTIDGGATWTPQASPTAAGLSAISFAPGGVVGYMVGNASLPDWTIYKTADSGATWNAVTGLGATGAINLTGVSCLDANNAVAVGTNGQIRHTTDGGVTWLNQSQNNLGSNALRDVKMIDANDIKAVGDFGTMFYTRNSGNFWFTPMIGNTAVYYATTFVDANHGWIAGSNGTVMRTSDAGRTWETEASGITNWRGIAFADLGNGWVVGDSGQIQHTTNGIDWAPQVSGTTNQLNGVWFVSATTGVAVGNSGTILKTTNGGATWVAKPSGTANGLNAVWFADATTGYVVGTGGIIRKTTNGGETWAAVTSGTGQVLLAVRGVDASHVWASGNGGTIVRTTNGGASTWTTLIAGAGTNPVRTVFFADANTGWFASNYGIVKKTTDGGLSWIQQNAGMPTSTLDPATGVWASYFTDANSGFLVGDSGTVRRTLDGGASWASLQFGTLATLNAVDFVDALNGWITGTGGFALHTGDGGQTWSAQKTGTNNALNSVSAVDTQTVWAAGDSGTLRRTTNGGQTWNGLTSGVTVNFKSISAIDATHAVASGVGGMIKYTSDAGSTWATGSVATTQQIASVAMVDTSNGWAVGARIAGNNVVWHTVDGGANWSSQTTTANAQLWGVYMLTPTVGYVGGDSGVVLRTTNAGATWVRMPTPTTLPVYSFHFSDANNGFAVGGGGLVMRTSDAGSTWALQSSGNARSLTAVDMPDANHAIIVGGQGTILRNGDVIPPVTSLVASPSAPNGGNGWYNTNPTLTLSSSKPGFTYYGWTSAAGPFVPYVGPFAATQGTPTLYYYSVDTSGNIEAAKTATFAVDLTPPNPPSVVTTDLVSTSTAQVVWNAGTDSISGVDHYRVYVDGALQVSTAATSAPLSSLLPGTWYSATVRTVDAAGNESADSLPTVFKTQGVITTPLTTLLSSYPATPDGAGGWYVTTPTVTLASLPMGVPGDILYSWSAIGGPYSSYASTLTPPAGGSVLYYSAHSPGRDDEATRAAAFNVDTAVPATPSVTASATSYSSMLLTWPAVIPPPSGIARYDLYLDGSLLTSTTGTDTALEVAGLSASSTHSFSVYAVSVAGTESSATTVWATTPQAPLPAAPNIVYAASPSGYFALLNWAYSQDAIGSVHYRIWRSVDGTTYSAVATTTGGLYGTSYVDSTLKASTRYWYAVSTVDSRGESALSDTSTAQWPSISTTTTAPQRVSGLASVNASGAVYLGWERSPNAATSGYDVFREDASLSTTSLVTSIPVTDPSYVDTNVLNGQTYYYTVAALDASGNVGATSLEVEARPQAFLGGESPHVEDGDNSSCVCHNVHTSTSPTKLIAFPGATPATVCDYCHPPAKALGEFLDPLAKSQHALGTTSSPGAQFTCLTCHKPLRKADEATANLMLTNSSSPCVVVTDTPAGNGFCYHCHGTGSTLPMGDMTGFENSAHHNVNPPAGASIACDACHESHSSRNEHLERYSGYMMCVTCHNSAQSDPNAPDIWSKLTLNSDANAKHPLLPEDQTNGARMTCQNCHNTHASTTAHPLVNPHDPSPSGEWTGSLSDQKEFCFTCHDGKALPTSQETTPWASAVLGSNGATTVADIKSAYQVNVHGFGSPSGAATVTAYLRPDMGYQYGAVLECRTCHDPHGTANNYALQQNVSSANGQVTVGGIVVAKVPSGGYDLRFFCSSCHLFDPTTHESLSGTSTATFPMDCTACHRHIKNGTPTSRL